MFRVFVLLTTAAAVLLVCSGNSDLVLGRGTEGRLVGSTQDVGTVLNRPAIRVLSAPTDLELSQSGSIQVQAMAPAEPGDTIYLDTAGTYNMGYNRVSGSVLNDQLQATLPVPGRKYLGSFNYWARIPASGSYLEGKSASFAIAIVAAAPPEAPVCGTEAELKADGQEWVCTFADDFSGTELDRRYWVPQVTRTSGFTTGTRSRYACAEDSAETVAVRDGNLTLSLVARSEVRACGRGKSSKYAFGQVMHFQTFAQTYGKYEVRARFPDVTVPGVQQSFWLWPKKNTYGGWPASGEIDFAEHYSSTPGVDRPYVHYLPGAKTAGTDQNITTGRCDIEVGAYNTYGVEWAPGRITILLNGQVCFVNDYSSAAAAIHGRNSPFDKPFFLSLNQAMGATGNLYDPALVPAQVTTEVDYVRIWR